MAARSFGLRGEAKLSTTFASSSASVFCSYGGCSYGFLGHGIWQLNLSVGPMFAF
jgi:hypothetical protein